MVKNKIIDQSDSSGFPKFDLMLLGMGPDGHVASLFPGHPLCQENEKWVTFIKNSPKPPPERISFTFPVINSSANIALVVAGAGKADVVHAALGDGSNSDKLPVQMVSPEGELTWFLDKGAASKLYAWSSFSVISQRSMFCVNWDVKLSCNVLGRFCNCPIIVLWCDVSSSSVLAAKDNGSSNFYFTPIS